MRVELKHPGEMAEADVSAWARLRAADARYANPFLSPGFALAAGAARRDARVLIARQGEDVRLVLPLQVAKSRLARPLGAPMCDINGPIAEPGLAYDLSELLAQAGVAAYAFSGWPEGAQGAVRGKLRDGCAVADLSKGFETYLDTQRDRFPKHFKKMRRLARQAERDFGAAVVKLGPARTDVLAELIAWKRAQYVRTRRHDVLGAAWTRGLLAHCAAAQSRDFKGVMATLHLGGRLAAAEFGLQSGGVLHGWIAGYDPAFAGVSPGLILQERLLEAAASDGVTDAVLGVGETHYKAHYCSHQTPVDEGVVVASGLAGMARGLTGDLWRSVEAGKGGVSQAARRARRRLDVILAVETKTGDQIGGFIKAIRREPAVAGAAAAVTALVSVAPPN